VCSVLRPRQHSIGYTGDGYGNESAILPVKRPNQQHQSTEGRSTKDKENQSHCRPITRWAKP